MFGSYGICDSGAKNHTTYWIHALQSSPGFVQGFQSTNKKTTCAVFDDEKEICIIDKPGRPTAVVTLPPVHLSLQNAGPSKILLYEGKDNTHCIPTADEFIQHVGECGKECGINEHESLCISCLTNCCDKWTYIGFLPFNT